MEIGSIIKCTAKEFSHGLTAENTKVATLMTRSMVMVSSIGQIIENTTVSGKMANNMVLVSSQINKVN